MATRRNLSILIGIIVVCTGIVLAQKHGVQEAQTSNHTQWEYGRYRALMPGNEGRAWSWQDANGLTRLNDVRQFAAEMGVDNRDMDTMDKLDVQLMNALGEKGWELLWIRQEPDASWSLWFKRPK